MKKIISLICATLITTSLYTADNSEFAIRQKEQLKAQLEFELKHSKNAHRIVKNQKPHYISQDLAERFLQANSKLITQLQRRLRALK